MLFGLSIAIVARELERVGFAELTAALRALPIRALGAAVALTIVNYAILSLQDQLAVSYAAVTVPRGQVALASFIAYAVSNSVGFAMLSGHVGALSLLFPMERRPGRPLAHRPVLLGQLLDRTGDLVAGTSLVLAPPSGLRAVDCRRRIRRDRHRRPVGCWNLRRLCVRGGTVARLANVATVAVCAIDGRANGGLGRRLAAGGRGLLCAASASGPPRLPAVRRRRLRRRNWPPWPVTCRAGVGVFDGLMVLFLRDRIGVVDSWRRR